jgi:Fe-S cluster assembly ATP-binding protein
MCATPALRRLKTVISAMGDYMAELKINELHVSVEGKEILKGLNLDIKKGQIHALMGPNGSGKSTLAFTLMGHPKYTVTKGSVLLDEFELLSMPVDERARAGLFLSFQYPSEVNGVTVANLLRTSYSAIKRKKIGVMEFMNLLYDKMAMLKMDKEFAKRYVNVGFSGGEKKRLEILQMAILEPKYCILDETDSGLDVDALKTVSLGIDKLSRKNMGTLIITHYNRILHYVKPDKVHIMREGKIVKSGSYRLAEEIVRKGYGKENKSDKSG